MDFATPIIELTDENDDVVGQVVIHPERPSLHIKLLRRNVLEEIRDRLRTIQAEIDERIPCIGTGENIKPFDPASFTPEDVHKLCNMIKSTTECMPAGRIGLTAKPIQSTNEWSETGN